MATSRSFEEVEAWQQARILAKPVYEVTSRPMRRPRWSQIATTHRLPTSPPLFLPWSFGSSFPLDSCGGIVIFLPESYGQTGCMLGGG